MFGPSPCPGHYSRRSATMASADSCLLTMRIAPHSAMRWSFPVCSSLFRLSHTGGIFHCMCRDIRVPVAPAGSFTGNCTVLLGKQASPDKDVNFPYATAPFTVSPVPRALTCCAALPGDSALYDVSVRQLAGLRSGFLQTPPHDDALAFG